VALTEKQIKRLVPRAKRYIVWDGDLPGFGLRVSADAETQTFVLKYRTTAGWVRWKSYGRVGKVPLVTARKRAKRDIGLVADGKDPLEQRDADRHAASVGDACDRFLKEHVDARRKPATARLYRLIIDGHLRPQLGGRPVAAINVGDIVKVHHRLKSTPYLANRFVAVTSTLMAWATRARLREGPNPCAGIEKFPERPRKRYLSPAELKRLGAALRIGERYGSITPAAITAIRLLLFTGCRVGEILSLRRDAVDLAGRALHLAESKTGPKVIVLNGPALAVLKAWPTFKGSPYVFPADSTKRTKRTKKPGAGHRTDLKGPWDWIRRRARLADVRLHDLRHSFASASVSGGQSLPIIGALLGHSQPATTARYAHLMDDPLRAASEAVGATIAGGLARRPRR
jgi:integrase